MSYDSLTDLQIVHALLERHQGITYWFLYEKCRPLFSSIFNKYYTDCEDLTEFINQIYLFILSPRTNGKCKLADFSFRCSLTTWLKIVTENFCRQLFARKQYLYDISMDAGDRNWDIPESIEINIATVEYSDAMTVLAQMPNERYRRLIMLRYLEEKTNEETAAILGMNMDNYYNKHRLAKAQYCAALRKEGLI